MHSFLSSSSRYSSYMGIAVDNYLSLTDYFSYSSQPHFLHKQHHFGLSELNNCATASVFHTRNRLNGHLTYSTERYSQAVFVRTSAIIILEPRLSAFRSHSVLITINPVWPPRHEAHATHRSHSDTAAQMPMPDDRKQVWHKASCQEAIVEWVSSHRWGCWWTGSL